jgi:cell division protein FtsQ
VRASLRSTALPFDIRLMRASANVLFAIAGILMLVLIFNLLVNQGVFAIQRLRVTGQLDHTNPVGLRAHAVSQLGGTFFTLDVLRAKRTFEALPWVRQASVSRLWPNGLMVKLEEHRAVALWGTEGEERLLNTRGEVFDANADEIDDELPRLNGPQGSSVRVHEVYQQLASRFSARDMTVVSLDLNTRQEWRMELDDGLALMLGRDDGELWQRIDRFLLTAEQTRVQIVRSYGGAKWARIDLRYGQGYAVALRRAAAGNTQNESGED